MKLDDALRYDPFADDFGSSDDRILRNVMVTTRRAHPWCHVCGGPIAAGSRSRLLVAIFDGELRVYRWCVECCEAMAKDVEHGDVLHTSERYRIGRSRDAVSDHPGR